MAVELNVLILEDRIADATLMVHELQQSGFTVKWQRVTTEAEFVAHLNRSVDVVLADYSLPGFDAVGALEHLLRSGLDIPFIIVSGTIGEDTAVAVMKLGATDFILKDRLLRLGPAVAESLEKRRMRREVAAAEQSLRDRDLRFRRLIENSTDGILLLGEQGRIEYSSQAAARILEDPDILPGRSAFDFFAPREAQLAAKRFASLLQRRDGRFDGILRCRTNGGSDCWIEASARNLRHDPAVRAIVVNFRNVTARVEGERKLVESARQLTIQNELLDRNARRLAELNAAAHQVIENVSHDFRTPLTVLTEFCSLLTDAQAGPITDQQREFLSIMGSRIDDLSLMVENLLDVSAHEAGITRMFRTVCDAPTIIKRIQGMLSRRAVHGRIRLDLQLPADLPQVFCDEERAQRVIVNLTINALKFTRPGGHVQVWTRNQPETSEIMIGVTDTGPGISESELLVLFERFRQLGHVSTTKGFGLGLSIAKEFVHLNLGSISAQSELGSGSTFSFTIPWAQPATVFRRYLDLIKSDTCPVSHVSLFTVGAGFSHLADVSHLLRLRLHSQDFAYPAPSGIWCIATPSPEIEGARFISGMQNEWLQLRKNSLTRDLPDLLLDFVGTWELAADAEQLIRRFCRCVEENGAAGCAVLERAGAGCGI